MDQFRLDGRRAIVTGAAGGLGLAMAHALAAAGARLVILDLDEALFERTALPALAAEGMDVEFRRCDVTSAEDVAECVEYCRQDPPTIVVNNAGGGAARETIDIAEQTWDSTIALNMFGVFNCSRGFGRLMIEENRGGSIINIGSIYASVGADGRLYEEEVDDPIAFPSYIASKGGVVALTKALACAWGRHGIRVNSLSPGMMSHSSVVKGDIARQISHRTPLGRLCDPVELGGAVVFLASDAASFVTGHDLRVDGGWTAW